jgi:hypothetical protein
MKVATFSFVCYTSIMQTIIEGGEKVYVAKIVGGEILGVFKTRKAAESAAQERDSIYGNGDGYHIVEAKYFDQ